MKAEYDKETDTLTITLRDARVKESDEIRPGVIADFGYDGGVVGFEILQASKVVEQAGESSEWDERHRRQSHEGRSDRARAAKEFHMQFAIADHRSPDFAPGPPSCTAFSLRPCQNQCTRTMIAIKK